MEELKKPHVSNIALLAKGLTNWTGGVDYLRLCATSLLATRPLLDVSLLFPESTLFGKTRSQLGRAKRSVVDLLRTGKIPHSVPSAMEFKEAVNAIGANALKIHPYQYIDTSKRLAEILKQLGCDAVFPAVLSLGTDFSVPWVGYIPDFQHRHMPHFFTVQECRLRDQIFGCLIRDTNTMSVNSRAVAEDIKRFYPTSTCKVFVLPFAPIPDLKWLESNQTQIREKYNLPDRFFLISNQFWIHKSHITAFEALQSLHRSSAFRDVELICTGTTQDFRWPDYFAELMKKVELMGLSTSIRILGKIPKLDQIEVMKQAVAVIQPTLFEGGPGGGSVYDAVAVGIRVAASDIPVNREIKNPNIHFFKAGSSDDLVRLLGEMLNSPYTRPTVDQLLAQGDASQRAFGTEIIAAIEHAISMGH